MKQSGNLQNNLVVLRAEKRWSQTDLANKAGVSRQTIASIEANRYNPSLILAFEIAHILGKEFHEVFQYKIEGEDERGENITGNAAKISLFVFLFLYLVIFLIGNLYSLTGEQYKLANAFLLAGVLCSYALTIVVLKRKY